MLKFLTLVLFVILANAVTMFCLIIIPNLVVPAWHIKITQSRAQSDLGGASEYNRDFHDRHRLTNDQ